MPVDSTTTPIGATSTDQERQGVSAVPVMPDFMEAFEGLEEPIDKLVRRVHTIRYIANEMFEHKIDGDGFRRFLQSTMEALSSVVEDSIEAVDALERHWSAIHNQRCDAETAEMKEWVARGGKLDDLFAKKSAGAA